MLQVKRCLAGLIVVLVVGALVFYTTKCSMQRSAIRAAAVERERHINELIWVGMNKIDATEALRNASFGYTDYPSNNFMVIPLGVPHTQGIVHYYWTILNLGKPVYKYSVIVRFSDCEIIVEIE